MGASAAVTTSARTTSEPRAQPIRPKGKRRLKGATGVNHTVAHNRRAFPSSREPSIRLREELAEQNGLLTAFDGHEVAITDRARDRGIVGERVEVLRIGVRRTPATVVLDELAPQRDLANNEDATR